MSTSRVGFLVPRHTSRLFTFFARLFFRSNFFRLLGGRFRVFCRRLFFGGDLFRRGQFDRLSVGLRDFLTFASNFNFASSFGSRILGGRGNGFAAFQAGEVIIDRDTDFFHRLGADAFDGFELLGRHVGQVFDGRDAGSTQFLDQAFAETGHILKRRGSLRNQRRHLLFHFLTLFFLALNTVSYTHLTLP